ncbi:MAG: hypothetical protein ACK47B_21960 [Armatimonadota bacterium]
MSLWNRLSAPHRGRLLLAALIVAGCSTAALVDARMESPSEPRWWKGNLHTHSLWSDGDDYPEMIVDWYRQRGYQFLALSDHNVLSEGERWIDAEKNRGGGAALEKYRKRFGSEWVEERTAAGKTQVRLKPIGEYRHLFEEPNRFLLIQSEEITDSFQRKPIHMNAHNLRELIKPQGGKSVTEVMQNNVNAVLEQRRRTGQPMFPHLNHPNFGWAVTAEDMLPLRGERFFEVYNGHPAVYNYGDDQHAGTERIWDILLSQRLAEPGGEVMYGLATDDSHQYHSSSIKLSNPGRGWVTVRARKLTPEAIIHAMEAGEFYASTGVELADVSRETSRYALKIKGERGVSYRTQFIGTRKGFDRTSTPVRGKDGQPLPVTRRYSREIGVVLAEVPGTSPTYTLKGDELYVRAKVISTRPQQNPFREGDTEVAWTQPLVPSR